MAPAIGAGRFEIVVEAAGYPATVRQALAFAAPRGRVLLFGLPEQREIPLDIQTIILRELSIFGVTNAPHVWQRAIDLLASGRVRVAPLVTHRFSFEQLPAAVAAAQSPEQQAIKVIVTAHG